MISRTHNCFPHFFHFLRTRKEIAFETEEFFVRKPSELKRRIANLFYNTFPYSRIAYHISLEGEPPIFVLDLETNKRSDLTMILEHLKEKEWQSPMITTSGNSGFHLFYKCNENTTLNDMELVANRLKRETGIEIDTNIYRHNHLIRGILSINHKFDRCPKILNFLQYSIPIFFNNNGFLSIDEIFDLGLWSIAKIKSSESSIIKQCYSKTSLKRYTPNTKKMYTNIKKIEIDEIKDTIFWLIEAGVDRGSRHDAIFAITTTLNALGYDRRQIIDTLLVFNLRCRPPEDSTEVVKQAIHILHKNYSPPSLKWLIKHDLTLF